MTSATIGSTRPEALGITLPGTVWVVPSDAAATVRDNAVIARAIFGDLVKICDGVNDEIEFKAAVDVLQDNSVLGIVHVSAGTLFIDESNAANLPKITQSGIVIEGEGFGTELRFVTNAGADRKMITFTGASDFELLGVGVRDLRITAFAASHHAIEMGGVGFGYIKDCFLKHEGTEDGTDEAIFLTGGIVANRFLNVDGCMIQGKWGHGIELGGKNLHCSITDTFIRQVKNDAINIRSTDADNPPEHITIAGCHLVDNTDHGIRIAEGNFINIDGCSITDNGKHGVRILDDDVNFITISNCPGISANDWSGIEVLGGKGHIIIGNQLFNNGLAESTTPRVQGIYIDGDEVLVTGNRCYDTRVGAARTQQHGIFTDVNATLTHVYGNFLDNNETAEASFNGTGETIHHNSGWVTEGDGTGSVASGATTDIITHGLSVTPTVEEIRITFAEQGDNDYGRWWVDTITATVFTLNVSADPGASNLDFGWAIQAL